MYMTKFYISLILLEIYFNRNMSYVQYVNAMGLVLGTTVIPDLKTTTSQDLAHVICTDTYMAIQLERSTNTGIHEDHLQLNDPACTFYSNGSHVIANMSLNTCGTVMEDDGTNLIFRNKVVSAVDPSAIIMRQSDVEINFYCAYPKQNQVFLQFRGHRPPVTFTEKRFGTFTYQFEFFESDQFSLEKDPNDYPLVFNLGEMMYMQIESSSPIPNTVLFAESCKAAPSDNPSEAVSYPIIQNGCKVDPTVQIYSNNQSNVQIAMKAFTFIGQHDQVFITCSVIMCQAGDAGSRCYQGCTNPAHQINKRETHTQTGRHYISQGPLRLRRDVASKTHNKKTKKHLNLNLVFVAGGVLVGVAMVCAAVLYRS
ncbi:hypothetical protein ACEWY4_024880 [Coilia grayii]|uniref:ZP domain-containing protein n=1 Tax=Coilia grayii TaxID=363190 RepID=A0ABD1IVZ6_9TELE